MDALVNETAVLHVHSSHGFLSPKVTTSRSSLPLAAIFDVPPSDIPLVAWRAPRSIALVCSHKCSLYTPPTFQAHTFAVAV